MNIREKVRRMMEEQHLLDNEPFEFASRRFPEFPVSIASAIIKEDIIATNVEIQKKFLNPNQKGRAIITDVIIRTKDGRIFNLEPNTYRKGAILERGLFHSYMIGTTLLKKGEDWKNLRKGGIILQNQYDILKDGNALSKFRMQDEITGRLASEKGITLYVANCSYRGNGPLSLLYEDLMTNYIKEETRLPINRNVVKYLLGEEVQIEMTERQEKIMREVREEASREAAQKATLKSAKAMINDGISAERVYRILQLSEKDIKALNTI